MSIAENIASIKSELGEYCKLVAVSKTKPIKDLQEAYDAGQRIFGENKVQELAEKHEVLPKDIQWHMIGHLQRNKVKYIAPFVSLIHAVDSLRLIKEINKQAAKHDRVIDCLLQVHIAEEDTKFGFDYEEVQNLIFGDELSTFNNIRITGLMGMATNTSNEEQVHKEFATLSDFVEDLKSKSLPQNINLKELSIGMSGDYKIALQNNSTLVRIGSSIFGARNYQ